VPTSLRGRLQPVLRVRGRAAPLRRADEDEAAGALPVLRPTCASSGWRWRSCAGSRPACSIPSSADGARSARFGAGAGRGGERLPTPATSRSREVRRRRVVQDGGGDDGAGNSEIGEPEGEQVRDGGAGARGRPAEARGVREPSLCRRYVRQRRPTTGHATACPRCGGRLRWVATVEGPTRFARSRPRSPSRESWRVARRRASRPGT
jgi:hypothetical protein